MAQKFYDLKIWQNGYKLLMEIYDLSVNFPAPEKFSLVSQMIRSANGVIANIAESHGRYYYADKVRVLYTARGEIEETQSHLRVALGRKYINQEDFNNLDDNYEGLIKGINRYINFLIESKDNNKFDYSKHCCILLAKVNKQI